MSKKYVKLDDIIEFLDVEIRSLESSNFPYNPIYDYRKTEVEDIKEEVLGLPTVELPRWHDLRKNPEDLPNEDGQYYCNVRHFDDEDFECNDKYVVTFYKGKWLTHNEITYKVTKWIELPQDED